MTLESSWRCKIVDDDDSENVDGVKDENKSMLVNKMMMIYNKLCKMWFWFAGFGEAFVKMTITYCRTWLF